MSNINRLTSLTAGLLLALCLAGCVDRGATVTGLVTYENQPIETGQISFLPVDGRGPAVGGKVSSGKFKVEKIQPGEKIVEIIAVKEVSFARSSEEAAKLRPTATAGGNTTGLIDPADILPPDAEGNNARVELKQGLQELNFALKKPTP